MREDASAEIDQREIADGALREALALWVSPEIERRTADGRLPPDFHLRRAQVILSLDAAPQVRLNDEVMALIKARFAGGRVLTPGDDVYEADIAAIESMTLTAADANAAHFTFIQLGGATFVGWDFRYNAARAAATLRLADEFLATAGDCIAGSRSRLSAFIENLLAAVELTAKAHLLLLPKREIIESTNHGYVIGQYNLWSKLDATDAEVPRVTQ